MTEETTTLTRGVLPQHQALIVASAISPEVASARGYRSIKTKAELRRRGFSDSQCRVPALLIPIYGPTGELSTYQARPDEPRIDQRGKPVKYETPGGSRMALDVPPAASPWIGDPARPLFITEGVRKADAAVSAGLSCIALLGVWNWRGKNEHGGKVALPEWESIALNGRQIYIAFDSDVMTKPAVHAALVRLKAFVESRKAHVLLIYLPPDEEGSKVGVDDYLAAGHTAADLLALATPELRTPADDAAGPEELPAAAQAEQLVAIGRRTELFHDPQMTPFAAIEVGGHREVWPLVSRPFRRWLRHVYFDEAAKAPSADAVAAAIGVLEGLAVFDGPEWPLATRVARHEGAIWYDLADSMWRAVRVDADGWQVVEQPPPLFRRYSHQAPPVIPVRGGDLRALFQFLNVSPEERLLLCGWLVTAFIPDIPHPIPDFHGEKGAGKSAGQRVLRRLIDPSAAETLAFASEIREVVQQLAHHYAPIYDNLDTLPPWLSDLLCRAVTGEGFTKRELYTDDNDIMYAYRRVVLLNGVNIIPQRSDLLDRSILVRLLRIPPENRREERAVWADFDAARPRLLGAILPRCRGQWRSTAAWNSRPRSAWPTSPAGAPPSPRRWDTGPRRSHGPTPRISGSRPSKRWKGTLSARRWWRCWTAGKNGGDPPRSCSPRSKTQENAPGSSAATRTARSPPGAGRGRRTYSRAA